MIGTPTGLTPAVNEWKLAMEDACIVNWCPFYEDDPVKTLHSIVAQDIAFALDPKISSDAEALIERGRQEVLKDLTKDRTPQPCTVLDEDTNTLVDYCGDDPEVFQLGWKIIELIAEHGFVRNPPSHGSQSIGRLVVDLLGEILSPSLQQWVKDNDSTSG